MSAKRESAREWAEMNKSQIEKDEDLARAPLSEPAPSTCGRFFVLSDHPVRCTLLKGHSGNHSHISPPVAATPAETAASEPTCWGGAHYHRSATEGCYCGALCPATPPAKAAVKEPSSVPVLSAAEAVQQIRGALHRLSLTPAEANTAVAQLDALAASHESLRGQVETLKSDYNTTLGMLRGSRDIAAGLRREINRLRAGAPPEGPT